MKNYVNKLHKEEIESFEKELNKNSEDYVRGVKDSGYEYSEEYESNIMIGCMRRLLIISIILVAFVITYLKLN